MPPAAKAIVTLGLATLVAALWACTVLVDDTCTLDDGRCEGNVAVACQVADPSKPTDTTHAVIVRQDCADGGDICADPGKCVHTCQSNDDCAQKTGLGHCAAAPVAISDAAPPSRTCVAFREAGAPCDDDPTSCGPGLSCLGAAQADAGIEGGGADAASDGPLPDDAAMPSDDGGKPDAGPEPSDAAPGGSASCLPI
jgi:hypothetical protein